MASSKTRSTRLQSSQRWLPRMLCALLGLLWAVGPTLHGVVHLADVQHIHTPGAVHSHEHHDHGDSASHTHHEHADSANSHASNEPSKTTSGEHGDQSPTRDERSQVFFFSLEFEAPATVAVDVEFNVSRLATDESFVESSAAFSPPSIGASGPRGPPIWT